VLVLVLPLVLLLLVAARSNELLKQFYTSQPVPSLHFLYSDDTTAFHVFHFPATPMPRSATARPSAKQEIYGGVFGAQRA
jgi:hypothetical protein